MKKNIKQTFIFLSLAALILSSLVSCASQSSSDKPSAWQQSQSDSGAGLISTQVSQDITKDKYEEQIKYYIDLTESLQNELLILKEEKYIDECEYQLQITTLEQTIQNLKNAISASTQSNISSSNGQISLQTGFKYTANDGQITITGYNGRESNIIIPSVIDGLTVTRIGENAFKGSAIRSLVIPTTVTDIDWFAFSDCVSLQSITIPSSVKSIGYESFKNCPSSLKIICEVGSYAESYAKSWGIGFATE